MPQDEAVFLDSNVWLYALIIHSYLNTAALDRQVVREKPLLG